MHRNRKQGKAPMNRTPEEIGEMIEMLSEGVTDPSGRECGMHYTSIPVDRLRLISVNLPDGVVLEVYFE